MNLEMSMTQRPVAKAYGAISVDASSEGLSPKSARRGKTTSVKIAREPVHGVLLLDKPLGLSSNQALQKVKWLMRAKKAGHTGTLDPLASGVLPICFGAATKFSQIHLEADKSYVALVRLGQRTSTADAEGEVIETQECQALDLSDSKIQQIQLSFTGALKQKPPMFSALKVQGKNLYELAREGVTVDREARNIVIHDLKICHLQDADQAQRFINEHAPSRVPHAYVWDQLISRDLPLLALWVKCSKGTYIRTLGEDIGQALGSCAHLVGLRRVQTGAFDLLNCVTLDDLEKLDSSLRAQQLLPVESLLGGHTRITLDEEDAARFLTGLPRKGNWPDLEEVAVFSKSPHALLGSAYTRAGELIPGRLLNPLEINSILESLS